MHSGSSCGSSLTFAPMNLKQRINRYLIGLGLGIVLSIAFFGQRNWTGWMPGNRVLDRLVATYKPDTKGNCLLDCHSVAHSDLEALLGSGKVEFEKSETKTEIKTYVVRHSKKEALMVHFRADGEVSTIVNIESQRQPQCDCP